MALTVYVHETTVAQLDELRHEAGKSRDEVVEEVIQRAHGRRRKPR